MGASGASGSWLETIRKSAKQAISVQLGAILGLIVPFFALDRADNQKTLNAARLRRGRILEFELAKPRIHRNAKLYGGDEEDDSARRCSTRSPPTSDCLAHAVRWDGVFLQSPVLSARRACQREDDARLDVNATPGGRMSPIAPGIVPECSGASRVKRAARTGFAALDAPWLSGTQCLWARGNGVGLLGSECSCGHLVRTALISEPARVCGLAPRSGWPCHP